MANDRKRERRRFRPALDGGMALESRELLSHAPYLKNQFLLTHPKPGNAYRFNDPPHLSYGAPRLYDPRNYNKGVVATETARGGLSVLLAARDGSHFRASIQLSEAQYDGGLAARTGGSGNNVVTTSQLQPNGTVRAYAMPGGKVGLIVDGTTVNSQLVIDPESFPLLKGYAHSFAYGQAGRSHVLQIGAINITSGQIGGILAYHSADLYGPLTIGGTGTVDRIAFDALQPGASIAVGGTLNTLDVANGVNLTSGQGITIGRDLNLLNVGQDMTLANGASLNVGRFAGLSTQPPKGTGQGSNFLSLNQTQVGTGSAFSAPSVSAYIGGNLTLGAASQLRIGSGIANSSITSASTTQPTVFLINGAFNGISASQVIIPNINPGTTFTYFDVPTLSTKFHNLVALNGINFQGP